MALLRRRLMVITVPILLIILIGMVLILLDEPIFDIHIGSGLTKREKTAISVSVLTEVRKIFTFNTMEVVYKSVFPHDFLADDVDWDRLAVKTAKNSPLTLKETEQWYIYNLCRDIGINPEKEIFDFVVITSIIKIGYSLEDNAYPDPETIASIDRFVRFSEDRTRLFLKLPESEIAEFIIEDSSSETYGYPDVDIQPEKWRELSVFVSQKMRERIREEGMLEKADEKGKDIIEKMMHDAGFKEIVFLE